MVVAPRLLAARGSDIARVCLVINGLCFGGVSFSILFGLRIIAGVAAAFVYVVALAGIVDTRAAVRNTALLIVMQVVFAACSIYALDAVKAASGLDRDRAAS